MSRIIDADKLYPDVLTNKGGLAISQSQIANAETIVIPNYDETINNIKAEIRKKQWHLEVDSANQVIEIIDKYWNAIKSEVKDGGYNR